VSCISEFIYKIFEIFIDDFNIHINSLSDLTENFVGKNDNDTVLLTPLRIKRNSKRSFNQNSIHRSTLSLSKAPIYAKIVKSKWKLLKNILRKFDFHSTKNEYYPTSSIK
jgi:hypothetical protein